MNESNILKLVMMAGTRAGSVLFRNNTGQGWIGRSRRLKAGETLKAHGGELLIYDPRPLHAGLCVGSGDLIGWHTVTITPEMVGRRVAVFLSAETKSAKGRLSGEQKNWQHQIRAAGGVAIVCRSADEFTEALREYKPP